MSTRASINAIKTKVDSLHEVALSNQTFQASIREAVGTLSHLLKQIVDHEKDMGKLREKQGDIAEEVAQRNKSLLVILGRVDALMYGFAKLSFRQRSDIDQLKARVNEWNEEMGSRKAIAKIGIELDKLHTNWTASEEQLTVLRFKAIKDAMRLAGDGELDEDALLVGLGMYMYDLTVRNRDGLKKYDAQGEFLNPDELD